MCNNYLNQLIFKIKGLYLLTFFVENRGDFLFFYTFFFIYIKKLKKCKKIFIALYQQHFKTKWYKI